MSSTKPDSKESSLKTKGRAKKEPKSTKKLIPGKQVVEKTVEKVTKTAEPKKKTIGVVRPNMAKLIEESRQTLDKDLGKSVNATDETAPWETETPQPVQNAAVIDTPKPRSASKQVSLADLKQRIENNPVPFNDPLQAFRALREK